MTASFAPNNNWLQHMLHQDNRIITENVSQSVSQS